MRWFNKLPHTKRVTSGLEWTLWKKLPPITFAGTFFPLAVLASMCWIYGSSPDPSTARWLLMVAYVVIGIVLFHWSMVITVAFGCFIVMIIKGPGYVADAYLLPRSGQPRRTLETIAEANAHRPVSA